MIEEYLKKNNIDVCDVESVLHFLELEGVISTTYFYHLEIYKFIKELDDTCESKKEVIITTCQHFRITDRHCYNIINKFNKLKR